MRHIRHTGLAAAVTLAFAACGPAMAQEHELSFYLGAQSSPHSGVDFNNGIATTSFTAGWEGRSLELPPYYGFRYTYWMDDAWGFGVEMNHAKVYADDATLAASGFTRLEFTDGLNIITLNGFRRWENPDSRWTPYVGAGLGIAMPHVDVDTTAIGGARTFEYQVTGAAVTAVAGASYEINDRWSVFGEYKGSYTMNEADLTGGQTLSTNIITNAINFGVTFSF
jgi:lipid A oxidase